MKLGTLVLGLSLLLWSCKREPEISLFQFLHHHELNKVYDQKTVSIAEIPDIENYLTKKLPNNSFNRDNSNSGIDINYDNILEVIDSLDNVSYSIRFTLEDSPQGEFFNLTVGENADGDLSEPCVIRYWCDTPYVEEFIHNDYDMRYFNGIISVYDYYEFFSIDRSSESGRTNSGDIDVDPCDQQNYNGGGGGDPYDNDNPDGWNPIDPEGNGGGSGLGDIDTSGGGGSCTWSVSTTGPCGCGGTAIHPPSACCGGTGTGVAQVLILNCAGTRSTEDLDCLTAFTTGINSQEIHKDCVRLNHLLGNSEYSDALADIQENADGDVERGYDIISTDGVISTNFVPGTGGDVELNHGGNIIGGIHNHTTDGYSMFSGEDILKLYTYSVANPTAEVKSISTTVVTQVGTFSLTINDRSMLSYILNTESIGLKGLNDLLNGKYQKATTANDFKKALLDVFKEIQEGKGMPDNPVNLYEFDSFSNSFKLVTLDSNGEPKSESCI